MEFFSSGRNCHKLFFCEQNISIERISNLQKTQLFCFNYNVSADLELNDLAFLSIIYKKSHHNSLQILFFL